MTTLSRILRALVATLVVAGALVPGAGRALANGVGDLYVAVPAGVDEVYLAGNKVENSVDVGASPSGLAFTPDGASLFAIDERGVLSRIDIESISVAQTYSLPSDAVAIAHPKGDSLLIAYDGSPTLGLVSDGESSPTDGPKLDGNADLLAADRHEHRIVAARAGEHWLDVVESPAGSVKQVTMDGSIVALAIARDEGHAYVATAAPDQVLRVSLDTGQVDWRAELEGKPAALTAVPEAAIVAIGTSLYRVKEGKAAPWTNAATGIKSAVTGLATSDEGAFVYASMEARIIAVNVTMPTQAPAADVAVAGSTRLAPVPKASSLIPSGGENANVGTGGQTGTGSNGSARTANPSHAPATDTEGGDGRYSTPGKDPVLLLGVGGAIAIGVLLATRVLMRRSIGER